MDMHKARDAFDKKLRSARLRCSVYVLGEQLRWTITAAGAIAAVGLLLERAAAITVINAVTASILAGAVVVATGVFWALHRPSKMQAAMAIDERLGTKERFSTALALAGSDDPFACEAIAEAHRAASRLSIAENFPLRPTRRWMTAAATWAAVAGVFFFVPTMDLFARQQKRLDEQLRASEIKQVQVEVKQATTMVKTAIQQLGNDELAQQLAGLDQASMAAAPEDMRRQAIRKLGDLSDRIKQLQAGSESEATRQMQSMLSRLRGMPGGLSRKLNQSLAKGEFDKAAQQIRQLQKQLAENKLTDQQKQELQKQLADLARQLEKLAKRRDELEKALKEAGLDESLAKLSEKQLRNQLKRQGLSDKKIDEIMQKAAACRLASSRVSRLGEAMAAASGAGAGNLSADDLESLADQLDTLEAMRLDYEAMEAALDATQYASQSLGAGQCMGLGSCSGGKCSGKGGMCPWKAGTNLNMGGGTGGPGRGFGRRDTGDPEETSNIKTRVKGKSSGGHIIASWHFKGPQAKGQATRQTIAAVKAAKDRAAEAINENRIPKRYESSVKKYFNDLEQNGE